MKKGCCILLIVLAFTLSFSVNAVDADNMQVKVYDECVSISGYLPLSQIGDTATLLILNRDVDINDMSDFSELADIVEYHGQTKVDSNNKYDFLFTSDYGGKHYAYLSVNGYNEVIKNEYTFISKTVSNGIPTDTQSNLSSYMKSNKNALGLDEDFYTDAVIEDMSKIMFASKGSGAFDMGTFTDDLERSYVIAKLNSGAIPDLSQYTKMIKMENASDIKYFSENAASVTTMMSGKNIQNISDFKSKLSEAIILSAINNASAEKIKQIVSDNSSTFGVASIGTELANQIKNSAPYSNIATVKTKISTFVPSGAPTGGSGGGGASGGGASIPNSFTNVAAQTVNTGQNDQGFSPFSDIEKVSWAKDAIVELYHSGIINGKEQGKFYPDDAVKRSEFAKMVTSLFKLNLIDDSFPFEDVSSDNWAYPYIKTAYLAGIVSGIDEKAFGGELNITRQDICTIVYRACVSCDIPINETVDKSLIDENEVSDYAKEAVRKLVRAGIISGDENSRFNPNKNATRAEAAMIMYKTKSLIK
ncbi:MAG: S-layer homology domain-containing protein [Firmicutes bacterium]|nr:S-layer homology domain-containing protein [Bacillota bacterium]